MLVWYGYSWITPDLFSDLFRYVSRQPMPVIHGTIPNFQYQGSSAKWIEPTSSQTFAACIIFYISGNSQECEFHACLLQKKTIKRQTCYSPGRLRYMYIWSYIVTSWCYGISSISPSASNHRIMIRCKLASRGKSFDGIFPHNKKCRVSRQASERSSKHNSAGSCFTHRYIEMWLPKKRESDSKMSYVILFYDSNIVYNSIPAEENMYQLDHNLQLLIQQLIHLIKEIVYQL